METVNPNIFQKSIYTVMKNRRECGEMKMIKTARTFW